MACAASLQAVLGNPCLYVENVKCSSALLGKMRAKTDFMHSTTDKCITHDKSHDQEIHVYVCIKTLFS